MRRYESYKDSGVEWLGEVPSHWELGRISTYFTERRTKVSDKDYPALSVTKLGVFPQWENVAKTNDGDNRKLAKKGDFVINSRSDRKGSSGIAKQDGSVSLINIVLQPKKINSVYSEYLFKSYSFIEEFYRVGHGIVADLWTTRFEDIKNSLIIFPPLSEQQKIAQFLDDKIAKIDQAVDLAEKQIALLKEHKQILIQNAVTRGLNPDVPLKDSGVEWIGQVPEHWEVKKLKFVLTLSNKKEESKNSNKRYIGMENIESFTGKINDIPLIAEGIANSFYKDEILFGKLRPYLAKSYLADFDGICSTEFLVYRSTKVLNNRFALNIFLSYGFIDAVNASTYGSKMPRANAEFISNMFLAIPPLSEQKQIIDYLDKQTAKIDQAIALKTAHIEKLKEYKSVLINDVVTGKVRV
ncbi:restriction endonuclease subunit S [uncultured Haemophilus sp.]|jgi:hypothetical protein|uniref:restriction endonuclease subunit S n=1 Tax=uncultured Haemophilus sp. TaxID=237779 RepID=UPI0015B3A419|nr:restriction endonuclease subunit S [uncultured Haemophilus sp.]